MAHLAKKRAKSLRKGGEKDADNQADAQNQALVQKDHDGKEG